MSEPFLRATGLGKRFGSVAAVNNVSFDITRGEVLTLLGPSGCGKTTTLRMIAGFEKPDSGEIEVENNFVVSVQRKVFLPPEKREMGMVFQSYAIWPHLDVFENVAYPLRVRRVKSSLVREKVESVLAMVGLAGLEDRPAMLLSGGQQQRVALARALVYSPKLLLLDEPLSNLDAKLREQMRVELKELQRRLSITVVFVTHDQIEAMTLSDRLAVMSQGKIEHLGTPQEIYTKPATSFVQEFLGRVIWLEGSVIEDKQNRLSIGLASDESVQIHCGPADDNMKTGEPVVVAVRPEDVKLAKDRIGDGSNQVPCTVETAVFLGDRYECHLRFGSNSFTLYAAVGEPYTSGEKLFLVLPENTIRVWRKAHTNPAAVQGNA
ncbi:MAG: ATP-binding cassette domain-containing protein [Deltaproteobacteria bacterium]|nr:ATP-binding cassette domain-containing protein [Deltaproteobacteria bacterium]